MNKQDGLILSLGEDGVWGIKEKPYCTVEFQTKEDYEKFEELIEGQLNNGWIPISEKWPETYKCVEGNDVYNVSDDVLCSAYNEDTLEYETWIDYIRDGEWQSHEYYEGEELAWQPLPEPYQEENYD